MKELATKPAEPLTRRQEGEAAVERIRAKLTKRVTKVLTGLFKEPGEPGYNPDAERTKAECSMRTHVAVALAEQLGITRPIAETSRPLGIIVLQSRIEDAREWEKQARVIDAEVKQ